MKTTNLRSKAFGKKLRELRLLGDFSVREFSKLVGVSPAYVSRVESGDVMIPTANRICRMAEILDIDADELLVLAGRIPNDIIDTLSLLNVKQLDSVRKFANGLLSSSGNRT